MHLREKLSICEISWSTGLSCNTASKHLAANTIKPKFATSERPSKLDPFSEKLAGWLKAEIPTYKDLSGFDFTASEINEATVRQLHRGEFIEGAQNVVLIGSPATGKIHVATALSIKSIEQHHRRVRFTQPPACALLCMGVMRRNGEGGGDQPGIVGRAVLRRAA